jgi:hypothetical protein
VMCHTSRCIFSGPTTTPTSSQRIGIRWHNAISVFHHNDIVEEIATLRPGEIDTVDEYISEGQKMPPHRWRVRFLDGREPLFQYFVREEDLRLIKCPHTRSFS